MNLVFFYRSESAFKILNLKNNILCQIYYELEAQKKKKIFYYHQTINTFVALVKI